MTKYLLLLSLLLAKVPLFAQNHCKCNLLIDPNYYGKVVLYSGPGGKVLSHLKNDSSAEDYLALCVDNDTLGYFHAKIQYCMSGKSFTGWIRKKAFVGIYTRNYSSMLHLYTKMDTNSKVRSTALCHGGFFPVSKCENRWVYVKQMIDRIEIEGWIDPQMQCDNPYTTCN